MTGDRRPHRRRQPALHNKASVDDHHLAVRVMRHRFADAPVQEAVEHAGIARTDDDQIS
jgi:hypothetical protein